MRVAMSVGAETDLTMLRAFLNNGTEPMMATDADDIAKLFKWVTMSTISRMSSVNPDDVKSFLKFDEKDLGQGDESSTKTYESKEKFSLENAESNMDLEFSDGQLSQVSFTFDIEQDANTWIQKEVDELNSLYGGGIATGLGNQIYQWQGEQDTVLQLTAFTEGDESATVILSVASMEYSIGS